VYQYTGKLEYSCEVMSELKFWKDHDNLLNEKGCYLKNLVSFDFIFICGRKFDWIRRLSWAGKWGYIKFLLKKMERLSPRRWSLEVSRKRYKVINPLIRIGTSEKGLLDKSSTEVVGSLSRGERLLCFTWRQAIRRVWYIYKELKGSLKCFLITRTLSLY
jgi:hypothetical protein